MKKVGLLIVACIISQVSYGQFTLGVKGGLNFSNLVTNAGSLGNNIKESKETQTGYAFGLYSRIGDKFFLQPEVLFSTKGGKVEFVPTAGGSPVLIDIKTNNIDIPVLVGFKLFNRIRIQGGPMATIKLSEDGEFVSELKKIGSNVNEAFAKATYGYQVGVGVKLLGFDLDLRNIGSLGDLSESQFGADTRFNQTQKGWQLTLGHKIL